jgi:hypothetical protein
MEALTNSNDGRAVVCTENGTMTIRSYPVRETSEPVCTLEIPYTPLPRRMSTDVLEVFRSEQYGKLGLNEVEPCDDIHFIQDESSFMDIVMMRVLFFHVMTDEMIMKFSEIPSYFPTHYKVFYRGLLDSNQHSSAGYFNTNINNLLRKNPLPASHYLASNLRRAASVVKKPTQNQKMSYYGPQSSIDTVVKSPAALFNTTPASWITKANDYHNLNSSTIGIHHNNQHNTHISTQQPNPMLLTTLNHGVATNSSLTVHNTVRQYWTDTTNQANFITFKNYVLQQHLSILDRNALVGLTVMDFLDTMQSFDGWQGLDHIPFFKKVEEADFFGKITHTTADQNKFKLMHTPDYMLEFRYDDTTRYYILSDFLIKKFKERADYKVSSEEIKLDIQQFIKRVDKLDQTRLEIPESPIGLYFKNILIHIFRYRRYLINFVIIFSYIHIKLPKYPLRRRYVYFCIKSISCHKVAGVSK